jgi:hypothetical protein
MKKHNLIAQSNSAHVVMEQTCIQMPGSNVNRTMMNMISPLVYMKTFTEI